MSTLRIRVPAIGLPPAVAPPAVFVNVEGVWKPGIVFVKIEGTWRQSQLAIRIGDTWQ
jgi:hypothetical protein